MRMKDNEVSKSVAQCLANSKHSVRYCYHFCHCAVMQVTREGAEEGKDKAAAGKNHPTPRQPMSWYKSEDRSQRSSESCDLERIM